MARINVLLPRCSDPALSIGADVDEIYEERYPIEIAKKLIAHVPA